MRAQPHKNSFHVPFRFCPKCTQRLRRNERLFTCSACDFYFYLNPAPTNAVILRNAAHKILFVKRAFPPKKGWWDLPGGFVDFYESMEAAVRREIREELGITLTKFRYFFSDYNFYHYKGITYQTLDFVFLARLTREQEKRIRPGDDAAGIAWFELDKLPMHRISFPSLREALRRYRKFFA